MEEELPMDEDDKAPKDWSDIIPNDEIKKFEEEEQQREILKTILKPRNRKPINQVQNWYLLIFHYCNKIFLKSGTISYMYMCTYLV